MILAARKPVCWEDDHRVFDLSCELCFDLFGPVRIALSHRSPFGPVPMQKKMKTSLGKNSALPLPFRHFACESLVLPD